MWREAPESTEPSTPPEPPPPLTVAIQPTPAPLSLPPALSAHPVVPLLQTTLGVPSFTAPTTYAPFPGLQSPVPAGAWPSARRAADPPQLTLAVFTLEPAATGQPGPVCGPAIALGPDGLELPLPLAVRLPCADNATAYQWAPQGWVAVANATPPLRLGVRAAFVVSPGVSLGTVGGAVVGGLLAAWLAWVVCRRRKAAQPKPHVHYV